MKTYQVWAREYRGDDCTIQCLTMYKPDDYTFHDVNVDAVTLYNQLVDDYAAITDYDIFEIKLLED